ncbi:hypothetical protein [Massilia aquatica]|uniref:hypothetical protein n=1 Tax=Massilia aquatica TaxID=2609000 RepID=UPI001422B980|nr:hypothetical protein [Massilia aquatica]
MNAISLGALVVTVNKGMMQEMGIGKSISQAAQARDERVMARGTIVASKEN